MIFALRQVSGKSANIVTSIFLSFLIAVAWLIFMVIVFEFKKSRLNGSLHQVPDADRSLLHSRNNEDASNSISKQYQVVCIFHAVLDLVKIAVKSDCHAAVTGVIKTYLEGLGNTYVIDETSPKDYEGVLVQILKTTYSTIDFKDCAASKGAASAAKQLLKIFVGYLEFVQKVGDIMNLSISAIHFEGANAALDTRFKVTVGTATTCVQKDDFALGSYSSYAIWTGYETPGSDVKVSMALRIASVDANHKIDGTLRIDIHTSRVYGYLNGNSIQFEWGPPDAPFSYTGTFSADKKTIDGQGGAGNY